MDQRLVSAIKSHEEITALREAAQRSARIHHEIMSRDWSGKTEIELANFFEESRIAHGLHEEAYATIVGSGERAMILHAMPTERKIRSGELILVDAGGKFGGYCADITRTFPVSGRFSQEQKQIYEIVLQAQKNAIASVRPGVTLVEIHEGVKRDLFEGLRRTDLLQVGDEAALKILFPHKTSHWLGRLVHDPCALLDEQGKPVRLQAGMVFTIEPGLYWNGLGVRIEDDLLVTQDGAEVLSAAAPKEVADLEAQQASAKKQSSTNQ